LGSPQGPNIIDWPKILAVGIASPAATVVTSRFGVAGTLLGLPYPPHSSPQRSTS